VRLLVCGRQLVEAFIHLTSDTPKTEEHAFARVTDLRFLHGMWRGSSSPRAYHLVARSLDSFHYAFYELLFHDLFCVLSCAKCRMAAASQ
jgi:hypothetical protein